MRFYTRSHKHYCGIDLHVKTMYICILESLGQAINRFRYTRGPCHQGSGQPPGPQLGALT